MKHWVTKPDREEAGYFDASIWEDAKRTGSYGLKRLINGNVTGTTNTAVLVGSHTYQRPWVRYEIIRSILNGNHIFGVHINNIKSKDGQTKSLGYNPFDYLAACFNEDGTKITKFLEYNEKWVDFKEHDGFTLNRAMASRFFNQCTKLSEFYSVYDWIAEDGYNNFVNWVK